MNISDVKLKLLWSTALVTSNVLAMPALPALGFTCTSSLLQPAYWPPARSATPKSIFLVAFSATTLNEGMPSSASSAVSLVAMTANEDALASPERTHEPSSFDALSCHGPIERAAADSCAVA